MKAQKLSFLNLYPDLLNLCGDRGNIICLRKRCEWRGIEVELKEHRPGDELRPDEIDVVFLGGGFPREQKITAEHLLKNKKTLQDFIETDGVMIAVRGGYRMTGLYYRTEVETVEGLSLVNIYTVGNDTRMTGNVVIESRIEGLQSGRIVGFENHSDRTYTGEHTPLGYVISGFGNNGEDGAEGVVYKNLIGTHLQGPLFPKNPMLADYVILKALRRKYGGSAELSALDDSAEERARAYAEKRFALPR